MKTYYYHEYSQHGGYIVTITEEQIIEQFWESWVEKMKKVGKENLITPERCIQDFCAIHWATEIK